MGLDRNGRRRVYRGSAHYEPYCGCRAVYGRHSTGRRGLGLYSVAGATERAAKYLASSDLRSSLWRSVDDVLPDAVFGGLYDIGDPYIVPLLAAANGNLRRHRVFVAVWFYVQSGDPELSLPAKCRGLFFRSDFDSNDGGVFCVLLLWAYVCRWIGLCPFHHDGRVSAPVQNGVGDGEPCGNCFLAFDARWKNRFPASSWTSTAKSYSRISGVP